MESSKYITKLFEEKVYAKNIKGIWYRFWWTFLLGVEFEKKETKQ